LVLSHGGKCVHASCCMNCISISGKRKALAFALRRAQAKKIKKVQKEYYLLWRCIAYGNSDLEMMKCTKDHKSIYALNCTETDTCFVPRTCFYRFLSERTQCWNAQLRSSLKCILAPDAHTWYIYMLLVGSRRWHLHIIICIVNFQVEGWVPTIDGGTRYSFRLWRAKLCSGLMHPISPNMFDAFWC